MRAKRITAAPLPDGRLQLWAIFDDELFSCWKTTTNPDSAWTDWQHFPQPSHTITYINAASLSDGRIQVWGIFDDELFSCWKTTTNPDSAWTDWQPFPQPH